MQSKTSFFNGTVFRKNLTRFAPAWGLYTLCLILGTLLLYSNGGTMKQWHFANNMAEMPQFMSLVNLFYAPIVAQLLFGDLFNSRMCNALHAMPLRRENWFVTNCLSGLTFSVLPGVVMAVLSGALCSGSLVRSAWQMPWLTLAATTLQFVCYFGLSVFAIMCSGNRLGMLLIYSLLNGGAYIAYWLVDTVYTPMLYGVNTPTVLAEAMTPMANMLDNAFLQVDDTLWDLQEAFGEDLRGAFSTYYLVPETWGNLLAWAAAGAVFALVGLMLYRKRDLECAGDAVAFPVLEPVFQVLGSVVCAAASQFILYMFFGRRGVNYLIMAAGLVVGWFACRMFLERSTRVFRLKNWMGLASLTGVIALSLFLTHIDVFGIETWQPKAEDVKSVTISYNYELTDKEDIQKILNLQSEALDTRLETAAAYIQDENGEWVPYYENISTQEQVTDMARLDGRYSFYVNFVYHMESGKEVSRDYVLWADGQAGDDYRRIMSRWEHVGGDVRYVNGRETEEKVLDQVLANMERISIEGVKDLTAPEVSQEELTELAEGFLAAVRADCDEGSMAQNARLHTGHFYGVDPETEDVYYRQVLSVHLEGGLESWYVGVFPDSHHTVKWLQDHGLLNYEIKDNTLAWY